MEIDYSKAYWGWHPARKEHEAGYTLFRREVNCTEPGEYHLIVSADNRFNFYLDGKLLGRGPVRGDLDHYFYDEYEGTLTAGKHIFAAEVIVWSEAWRHSPAPWSEIHACRIRRKGKHGTAGRMAYCNRLRTPFPFLAGSMGLHDNDPGAADG